MRTLTPTTPGPQGDKVCYGRWDMNRRPTIADASMRRAHNSPPLRLLLVVVALAMSAVAIGCDQTPAETPASNYGATVEVLLPTAEPTVPPTPAPTPVQPTDTPAPTYTTRSQPTYTPWPTPTMATAENREPAIPFNANMLDGSEFSLPDSFGSPTLLAFWAPW